MFKVRSVLNFKVLQLNVKGVLLIKHVQRKHTIQNKYLKISPEMFLPGLRSNFLMPLVIFLSAPVNLSPVEFDQVIKFRSNPFSIFFYPWPESD